MDPTVLYQHPLAYLLGLEGLALLRAFSGGYDGEFTLERFREIRELLDRRTSWAQPPRMFPGQPPNI